MAKTHKMTYKLQDIFRKRGTNHFALLREMTYKDKASYGCSPPCSGLTLQCQSDFLC